MKFGSEVREEIIDRCALFHMDHGAFENVGHPHWNRISLVAALEDGTRDKTGLILADSCEICNTIAGTKPHQENTALLLE